MARPASLRLNRSPNSGSFCLFMRPFKWSILLLIATALGWGGYQFLTKKHPKPAPLELEFLSVSNNNGMQIALFSVSNCTSRTVKYLSDGKRLPYYSLTEYLPEDHNVIRVTNYNLASFTNVRPAALPPYGCLTLPVTIPSGVTNAALQIHYEIQKSRLEDKARDLMNTYGGALPASIAWTSLEVKQPFW